MKIIFVLLFVVISLGCASAYKGPSPDFSLQGEEAEAEIEKYTLSSGPFDMHYRYIAMGPEKNKYTLKSLRPVVETVSPEAIKKINSSQRWFAGGFFSLALATGLLLIEESYTQSIGYYSLIAITAGSFQYGFWQMSAAADIYNLELRSKFSPGLGAKFEF